MKKINRMFSLALLISAGAIITSCSSGENKYTEKEVNVFYTNEAKNHKTKLRFYEKTKDIPYIGIKNYYNILVKDTPLAEKGDLKINKAKNEYLVETPKGGVATINTDIDSFRSPNYVLFNSTNYFNMSSDTGMVEIDGLPWIKVKNITYNKEANLFFIDFAKYKIDLMGDDNDVYFPFNTACDLFLNENLLNCSYNQKDIYVINGTNEDNVASFKNYGDPIFTTELSQEYREYNYMEYCLTYDKLLGRPNRSSAEKNLNLGNGLDYALSNNELGKEIKNLLLSGNKGDYLLGTRLMHQLFADGGHTNFIQFQTYISVINEEQKASFIQKDYVELLNREQNILAKNYKELKDYDQTNREQNLIRSSRALKFGHKIEDLPENLSLAGKKSYYKKDKTAVISVDDFMGENNNRKLWEDYYSGKRDSIPFDDKIGGAVGSIYNGIAQAKKDGVENVIIDLASNAGGSIDELMYLIAFLTNNKKISMYHNLTGQIITAEFDIDINLDKVFDEKDNINMVEGLNLGVLSSPSGFSCGGISPIYLHEANIYTMGNVSGGGSCSIYYLYDIYGLSHVASSPHQIVTLNGASIDAIRNYSCDKYIPTPIEGGVKNFDGFYDIEKLTQYMNEHYKK